MFSSCRIALRLTKSEQAESFEALSAVPVIVQMVR
jgi:hypothetical protein